MNNTVFIFDVDGCIMPNIFQNYGWDKDQVRETVIKEVNEKGWDVPLFPQFAKYFGKYCKDYLKIYFITGRQEKEFRKLTLHNLEELFQFEYDFDIGWYPPDKEHKPKLYFDWKFKTIKGIMKGYNKSSKKRGVDISFMIYDDWNEYFPKIVKFADKKKIQYLLSQKDSDKDWIL